MRREQQINKFRSDGKTVSPERLVVLLYERLAGDLADAHAAIIDGDSERRHAMLLHAQEIIEELAYAVRPDVWEGGDGLIALYDYLLALLVKANIKSDTAAIAEAARTVDGLAGAWREAYVELATVSASAS